MNPTPPETDSKEVVSVPYLGPQTSPEPVTETPLSTGKMLAYSIANFGYGAFYSLNNAVIPLYIKHFTNDARLQGLMGSTHSFEGAVIQPLVGSASDRLRTPLGRRRPFMLVFAPLSALLILLTPAAGRLVPHAALPFIIGAIFLFTVSFNIAEDPYKALMPDITPEPQRGKVSAVSQLVLVLGQAGLLLLPIPIEAKFALTALLMLVTTLLTVWLVKEPPHPTVSEGHRPHLVALREALKGLRTLKQAGLTLAGLFFSGLGIGAILPFLTTFVKAITKCTDHQAEMMFLVLMVSTALTILPFGWLTDRLGPKNVLLIGMACILVAALNGLWVTTLPQIFVVLCLAGVGNAAQTASAYPLLTKVVPHEEVGFYTGLQSTALSIAAPLTAVLTGELVNKGGYRLIFAVCGAGLLVTLYFLTRVRTAAAVTEIIERNREQGRTA
ncbi:MAG: MFS/sugar transport protein [Chthonomonadaceae bacterium]|nr:MFS/sugar transport protein [Chthonomonadaceae bacterium]